MFTSVTEWIHTDFQTPNHHYSQNSGWDFLGLSNPEIKLMFCFNNERMLDNCPFVAKISVNLERCAHLYFGVAYSLEADREKLIEWGKRFPEAKLLTFDGKYLETVS